VVVGANDQIFVLDSGNNRVQVVEGQARGVWKTTGALVARR
jgi:hypothetical protein